MYRQSLNKLDDVKVTLMQTSKKELCEIPNEYIDSITINWDDVCTMELSVPSIIYTNGVKKDNLLYDKIKGKTQQIIVSNPNIRFIITDMNIVEERLQGTDVLYKTKTIKCESFESTLTEKLILNEDTLYELANEDKAGLLDLFEQYNKNWSVKHISDNALYETGVIRKEIASNIGQALAYDGVRELLLFEYNKPITVFSNKTYIDFKVKYKNVVTKYNGIVQSILDFTHKIEEIHTSINKIQAYYTKYEGDYCVKYVISLADGIEVTEYRSFCFIDNMDLEIESIDLVYSDGEEVESTYLRRRNIEQGEYTWLDIFRETISNGYDGLYVEFDTINKEISIYNREEYGEHHGIQLSYDNYVKSINKNIVGDDIITKLRVSNSEETIAEVNKFGGDYIYDYSYSYNNDIMSDELKEAWDNYIEFVDTHQGDIESYRSDKSDYNKELIKLESERTAIDYDIQNLQVLQSTLITQQTETGVDMSVEIEEYYNKINERQSKFAEVMKSIQELNDKIELLNSNINALQNKYNFETCGFFDKDTLEELNDLTVYQEVQDDSFATVKELYENYLYLTHIKNNQGVEFTVDIVGFLENLIIPNGLTWDYYLQIGSFVDLVDSGDIDIEERGLRIIGYTLNLKENTVSGITLTNRDRKVDLLSGFTKLKEVAKRTQSFINNNKTNWSQSISTNKNVQSLMSGIDTSKIKVGSDTGDSKIINSKAGLYVIDNQDYESVTRSRSISTEDVDEVLYKDGDKQIFVGKGIIAITDTGWRTCSTAITGSKICAEVIKGKLLIGEELEITTDNGEFRIGNISSMNGNKTNAFGLKISDFNGVDRMFLGVDYQDNKAKLEMYDETGTDLLFSHDGRISEFNDSKWGVIDKDVPVYHYLRLRGNVEKVEEVILTVRLQDFRVFSKGLEASGGGELNLNGETASLQVKGNTDSTKDNRQLLFKPTGVKRDISEFTELEEYQMVVDETTNEIASIYLPPMELKEESAVIDKKIYSYETKDHDHTVDILVGNAKVSGVLNIDSHTHQQIYGVFVQPNTKPSDMRIYINGEVVTEGLNDDFELDITQYIPSIEGFHEIMITSETRGCLDVNLYCRSFSRWR
ncbi:hypothetical protein [Clostridium cuniculi]|uniref:hypothetical protein n=1 Tax=Clostridium cuniculi TaxID=2548455 RepID=UPI001054EDCB|nr:hypothetical protein [Clostridium cuniculi]